jgi:hypothetical protein
MFQGKFRKQATIICAAVAALGQFARADTVAYWRFEEGNAGSPATGPIVDSSGSGNAGTPNGGPVYSSNVPAPFVPGTGLADSLSLSFNGSSQRIVMADTPSLAINGSITLEAYIDPVSISHYGDIIFRGDDRAGLDPYRLTISPQGNLYFQVTDSQNDIAIVQAAVPAFNQWMFVAATLNASSGAMNLYFNNALVATTTTTVTPFGPLLSNEEPGVSIGSTPASVSPEYYAGLIDEVRISNTALSPVQFLDSQGSVTGGSLWAVNSSGDWNNSANWYAAVPNGAGAEADFFSAISKPRTVFTDTPVTVGTIHFNNANTYVLSGAGNLTLQGAPGTSGLVQVDQGTQEINIPTTIAGNTVFSVATGATLLIANPLTVNPGATISIAGGGTITYQSLITIQQGGQFNIANNSVAIGFSSPADDPVKTIAGYLTTGYAAGHWTGTGINSSTAAAAGSSALLSVGYADGNADAGTPAAPNEILVKLALAGDANLDGMVNFADLVAVVQNFHKPGTDWAHGNFDYGGSTSLADLIAVVANFNKAIDADGSVESSSSNISVQSTAVQFPEPGLLSMVALPMFALARRRRKGKRGINSHFERGQ